MTDPEDDALEAAIVALLDRRAASATICPSEAARVVAGDDDWRALMAGARSAAGRLAERGEVEVTQGGRVVDVATARGPVRIRRRARSTEAGTPG